MKNKKLLAAAELSLVLLVTAALFRAGQASALAQRGYEARGGEYLLLLLPLIYYIFKKIAADWIGEIRAMRLEEGEEHESKTSM